MRPPARCSAFAAFLATAPAFAHHAKVLALGACLALAACGGGGGGQDNPAAAGTLDISPSAGPVSAPPTEARATALSVPQAHRLLAQASFGPDPATVAQLQSQGDAAWIDAQLALPPSEPGYLVMAEASAQALGQNRPLATDVIYAWWSQALQRPDQLRQRVAYALSQIFVVSMRNAVLADNARLVASYMDMLTAHSLGSYRELLEGVALHPAMGLYLSHLMNLKEDPSSGRVPDENFAREVMQLFSIGLVELNDDGSPRLRKGQPIETYTAADVRGLAKVFTGWGWHQPAGFDGPWWVCFAATGACALPALQQTQPMSPYWQAHSGSEKRFLGITIAAQSPADPQLSLRQALDRLANHPNTAPFISKQLIQQLVTSNPSAAYVARVTQVFRRSGGHLGSVVRAILLDEEARQLPASAALITYGKLREPVLRWAQVLRAIPHHSTHWSQGGGFYLARNTESATSELGQTPLTAPSVFGFYRPGYMPPQTQLARQQLRAPEMQLTTESTVLGYANFLAEALERGWGYTHPASGQRDVQFDLSTFTALDTEASAARPQALVDAIAQRLLGRPLDATLNEQVLRAVAAMPRRNSQDLRRRAAAVVLMVAVSPSFLVQQ